MTSDDPFDDIFREFDRLLDELIGGGGPERPGERRGARVDVHDRDGEVEVVADLPGASVEDVDLWCDGRLVGIEAGDVSEVVELPVAVDETSADASFNNGVLSVGFEPTDDDATVDVT